MGRVEGKVAIVTGAAKGLGEESRLVNGQKLVADNTLTVTPAVVPA